MNLPTVLIGLVVLAVFAAIVAGEVKKRRAGGGCGCGCANCPNSGLCHPAKTPGTPGKN